MIYLHDTEGEVTDLASANTMQVVNEVAQKHNLKYLQAMIRTGFTVNLREVKDEIDSIIWPTVEPFDELALKFTEGLSKCQGGLAFLWLG